MKIPIFFCDTFTSERFRGNPTPVCLLKEHISPEKMHKIAKELAQPVTAFMPDVFPNDSIPIRYFTITGEIPACGHATLASAFIALKHSTESAITFRTIEDVLIDVYQSESKFFLMYPKLQSIEYFPNSQFLEHLQSPTILSSSYCSELQTVFLECESEEEVTRIKPNFAALVISEPNLKEVVVMARSYSEFHDVVLRSFCPWIGIDEDSVTGSIHAVLGHYWSEKLSKSEFKVHQVSERGGNLFVRVLPDKIELGGFVVPVLEGEMYL